MSCLARNIGPPPPSDLLESLVQAAAKAAGSILPRMGFDKPWIRPGNSLDATALHGAHIPILGDPRVDIGLLIDARAAGWVARKALWLEDEEQLGASDVSDAISEILNMIAGQIQYLLSRAGHKGTVGLPTFFESDAPLPEHDSRTVLVSFGEPRFFIVLSHNGG